jgi:hypothetical protein
MILVINTYYRASFETTEESMSLAGKVVRRAQAMSKTEPATTIY